MPTYTYECERCAGRFEIEQRISDPPRRRCPSCRGKVFRVIQPVAHILKGTGFYATDYRKRAPQEGPCDTPSVSPACEGCAKKEDGCSSVAAGPSASGSIGRATAGDPRTTPDNS